MKKTLTALTALLLVLMMLIPAFAEEADPAVAAFKGGEILKSEAQAELDYVVSYYELYGYDLSEYPEWMDSIRQDVLEALVCDKLVEMKLAEEDVVLLTDEETAEIRKEAAAAYEELVNNYSFYYEDPESELTEEEKQSDIEAAKEFLASIGYTPEAIEQDRLDQARDEAIFLRIAGDVTLTDDMIEQAYSEQLALDTELYGADLLEYEYACQDGEVLITWNPEGFRRFKQILFTLENDDDLNALYELLDTKYAAETDEEIAAVDEQIAALYTALTPTVTECLDRLNAGESFDEMIEIYGSDEGMTYEPFKTTGYAVYAESEMYEYCVRDAVMALENIGDISEPVQGEYGVYLLQYVSDVTPGAVPLAEITDQVKAQALSDLQNEAYEQKVNGWLIEAEVEYHPELLD